MRLVSARAMAAIDSRAVAAGADPADLVERAAASLRRSLLGALPGAEGMESCYLLGKGNNAADGAALARMCAESGGKRPRAVLAAPAAEGSVLGRHLALLAGAGVVPLSWEGEKAACLEAIQGAELIVDALAGTGLRGELSGALAEIAAAAAFARGFKASLDLPSGAHEGFLPGMAAFRADLCLTVELPKRPLYLPYIREFAGRIEVARGVFDADSLGAAEAGEAELLDAEWLDAALARHAPSAASHKGTRGAVAAFAGGDSYPGAAWIAAESAARAGAGVVTLWLSDSLFAGPRPAPGALIARDRDAAARVAGGHAALVSGVAGKCAAFLVGPGTEGDPEGILPAVAASGKPSCVDAGALRALAASALRFGHRAVLTPHPGECAALLGVGTERILADPEGALAELARAREAVVVLKGHVTWIGDGKRVAVVDGMNPAMATAGAGDVLAGIVAGLLARGLSPFDAACLGAAIHQEAGRACAAARGFFLAEELAAEAGRVAARGVLAARGIRALSSRGDER